MQEAATAAVSQSFAAMLASVAAPAKNGEPDLGPDNDDGLADDVAAFSYESALKGRNSTAATRDDSPSRATEPSSRSSPGRAIPSVGLTITEAEVPPLKSPLPDRKAASITIRVSAAECAQLRARAAESGLTVSAYLRSCIFEVESLRAQVKDALAELRSAAPKDDRQAAQAPPRFGPQPTQGWRSRLLPGWKIGRRLESA